MKELKIKEFEVKDGRKVAKFLVKTGLKATLFDIMFPKDNSSAPKNWIELRKHLQENYDMSDEDFRNFQKECNGNLQVAVARYLGDFPVVESDMGERIIDVIIEIFADDIKYDETVLLLAYLFNEDKDYIESLSIQDVIKLVQGIMKSGGFLDSLQPSTPQTETEGETQA